MVRAWFMDDDVDSDQRLEHHRNPPEFVDLHEWLALTGVEYFKVSLGSRALADKIPTRLHSNAFLEQHILAPGQLVNIPCAQINI